MLNYYLKFYLRVHVDNLFRLLSGISLVNKISN